MYNYVVKKYILEIDTMELTQIKTGIFGYSKKSVCQYIAEQNELNAAVLNKQKDEAENVKNELNGRIDTLSADNGKLTEEKEALLLKVEQLERQLFELKDAFDEMSAAKTAVETDYKNLSDETQELREKSDVISTAIINAEKCATAMINDANVRAQDMIDEAQGKVQDEVKRLETAKGYISEVRNAVELTLKKIDAELSGIQADISEKQSDVTNDKKASIKEKFGMLEKNLFKRA